MLELIDILSFFYAKKDTLLSIGVLMILWTNDANFSRRAEFGGGRCEIFSSSWERVGAWLTKMRITSSRPPVHVDFRLQFNLNSKLKSSSETSGAAWLCGRAVASQPRSQCDHAEVSSGKILY